MRVTAGRLPDGLCRNHRTVTAEPLDLLTKRLRQSTSHLAKGERGPEPTPFHYNGRGSEDSPTL